jgi:hypothetical protein
MLVDHICIASKQVTNKLKSVINTTLKFISRVPSLVSSLCKNFDQLLQSAAFSISLTISIHILFSNLQLYNITST